MFRLTSILLVLWISPAVAENQTAAVLADYQAAMAAYGQENYQDYASHLASALEVVPGHPILMRHLARAHAKLGNLDDAVNWLQKVADSGIDLALADDDHFQPLHDDARFATVLETVTARKAALGKSRLRHQLGPVDLVPEGLAYDPGSGDLFLGSMHQRRILRILQDGSTTEFANRDHLMGVLGLRVDVAQRLLWVCHGNIREMMDYDEALAGRTAVSRFHLDTGELLGNVVLHVDGEAHDFNDVALAPGGGAFVTDALGGALYRVMDDTLETLVEPGGLLGPNGVVAHPNGTLVYFSQYSIGLSVLDLDSGNVMVLPHAASTVTQGVDGLYFHNNSLIAVQNMAGLDRVARFHLSDDGRSITREEILDAHDPHLEDPTTGAIVGNAFYYIANSQLPKLDQDRALPALDEMDETFILELEL